VRKIDIIIVQPIIIYDAAGNVIETHKHQGDFKAGTEFIVVAWSSA